MSLEQQNTVWLNVANGVGQHGEFLKAFARAFIAADFANKWLLEFPSENFIKKYKLGGPEYLREEGLCDPS